jgi:hypothetical protein
VCKVELSVVKAVAEKFTALPREFIAVFAVQFFRQEHEKLLPPFDLAAVRMT